MRVQNLLEDIRTDVDIASRRTVGAATAASISSTTASRRASRGAYAVFEGLLKALGVFFAGLVAIFGAIIMICVAGFGDGTMRRLVAP